MRGSLGSGEAGRGASGDSEISGQVDRRGSLKCGGSCWEVQASRCLGAQVVTSEGLEQHPRWVPFILGTLGSSQHKQVCTGFLQKGVPRAWRLLGQMDSSWTPTFSGMASRAGV